MDAKLLPGIYYHIYNRGNNRENIFIEERNYTYFLNLYTKHVVPVVDTYVYCLLHNHFHLLLRVKDSPEGECASQKFSNFFNAYAKGYNQAYHRTGTLFQRPFKRIAVTDSIYFLALIAYIHKNPQKHGLVKDFRTWAYSSYSAFLSERPTHLQRDEVLRWFGGKKCFEAFHMDIGSEDEAGNYLIEDGDDQT